MTAHLDTVEGTDLRGRRAWAPRCGVIRMGDSAPAGAPLRDLSTRTDVESLLRRFYGEAFGDEVLAEPFAELSSRGLDEHLPVMCDFWETVLFRAGLYRRNALHAHRRVHHHTPLAAPHFTRWLALWNTTIDQMYRGPVAEHAKIQAARIATAMHRRLAGTHAPQLAAPPSGGIAIAGPPVQQQDRHHASHRRPI